jgi:hypothetical protein
MASYSELKNIEEQNIERESLTQDEAEDGPFLSTTARRNQISRWSTWLAWYQRHWPAIIVHMGLLAVNVLIVSVYATKGPSAPSFQMNPVMRHSRYHRKPFSVF